jgi:hypothetical protein
VRERTAKTYFVKIIKEDKTMLEIKVTVEATELVNALNNLAAAMSGAKANFIPTGLTAAPQTAYTAPAAVTAPTPPITPPVATPAANPAQYPAPGVPLAQPPTFTREQIMYAGSTLADAGKTQELINLLHTFGVQAVTELKQEQLGAFATAMREMGAKI